MGYTVPSDEEVLGALMRVMAREGTVTSQRELRQEVLEELRVLEPDYAVSGERVRQLAIRSGYVDLEIRAGETDRDPPDRCIVCGDGFEKVRNRTLDDRTVTIGWSCTTCPYWTGEDRRVPLRYTFHSKSGIAKEAGKGPF